MHFLHHITGLEKSVQKLKEKEQNERRNALSQMFASWREELDSAKKKEAKVRNFLLYIIHIWQLYYNSKI